MKLYEFVWQLFLRRQYKLIALNAILRNVLGWFVAC